ncbi:MAG: DUF3566 domain-containing protein [Ilumatobacter sp.]
MSTTESDLTSTDVDALDDTRDDVTEDRDVTDTDTDTEIVDGVDALGDAAPDDEAPVDEVLDEPDEDEAFEIRNPLPNADYEPLPEIIPATTDLEPGAADEPDRPDELHDSDEPGDATAREAGDDIDDEEVSERILDELRRADIDGPLVPVAPQDETTAARRRPRRAADYDPAPVPIPAKVPRVLGRKPRVRKVTRVVRHVDPWSVFKIALVAFVVLYVIVLTASVLLWNVATATGTIDNVERFFESFGWNTFEFNGGEIYHAGWIAGLFVVIGLTGLTVLTATLFNLITDLVGGVRVTVLEEEVVEARTSPMRRFVVRRSEPEVPAILRDGSGVMTREAVVDDVGANDGPAR